MSDHDPPIDFEQGMAEIERIVQSLEQGQPTLDESLRAFERGVELIQQCRRHLESVEKRVMEWVEFDEEGRARLRPFEHEPATEKSKRKGAGKAPKKDPPKNDEGLFD